MQRRGGLDEEPVEGAGELDEAFVTLDGAPGVTEGVRVESRPSRTHPDAQPSTRDVVEGEQVLGERQGMTEVRRGDQGAQAQPRGDGGRGDESGDHREPGTLAEGLAPREVVVGVARVDPPLIEPAPLVAGPVPAFDRQDDDGELHGSMLRPEVLTSRQRDEVAGVGARTIL